MKVKTIKDKKITRKTFDIVQVSEPALSDEILDLNNVSNGEFSIQKVTFSLSR